MVFPELCVCAGMWSKPSQHTQGLPVGIRDVLISVRIGFSLCHEAMSLCFNGQGLCGGWLGLGSAVPCSPGAVVTVLSVFSVS